MFVLHNYVLKHVSKKKMFLSRGFKISSQQGIFFFKSRFVFHRGRVWMFWFFVSHYSISRFNSGNFYFYDFNCFSPLCAGFFVCANFPRIEGFSNWVLRLGDSQRLFVYTGNIWTVKSTPTLATRTFVLTPSALVIGKIISDALDIRQARSTDEIRQRCFCSLLS